MMNNNKTKAKIIALILVYICFVLLSAYTFYLYALKSDYTPWGNSLRDGLYFLALFIIILPLMVLMSIFKILLWKINSFIRFSFLFYALLTVLPSAISIKIPISLGIGMLFAF